MFENLNAPKKSSLVFKQIIERIESGEFPPNTKLPNEIELTRMLGVSRPVVREALSALEIIELVERKAGDGTYIRELPPRYEDLRFTNEPIVMNFFKRIEASGGSYSAFEARSLMEPWLAGIVAVRADENDLEALKKICARMEATLESNDKEAFRAADVDFHRFIAHACKNEFLESFLLQAIDAEKFLLWRSEMNWPTRERMEKSVREHLEVADAIIAGSHEKALKSMEQHFVFHWGEVAKSIAAATSGD
ncbi:FadR family transcriptional regulator [Synergistaceae bacterium OttesenSCG-928-I11]|nr:FadR family transcriptional regulator [Synergistaceae bacterium OttesenSCG-928-I11]